eukprot:GDKH01020570.1.p5 GENE.GDKH01020570.1~~GDKH01020570.1.p5  ORF type:complete len:50 (-),score=0.10 GDKH01020570.1:68-217(-)
MPGGRAPLRRVCVPSTSTVSWTTQLPRVAHDARSHDACDEQHIRMLKHI